MANSDSVKTEVVIAFDAETTDDRLVDLAVACSIEQIVLAESCEFAHPTIGERIRDIPRATKVTYTWPERRVDEGARVGKDTAVCAPI